MLTRLPMLGVLILVLPAVACAQSQPEVSAPSSITTSGGIGSWLTNDSGAPGTGARPRGSILNVAQVTHFSCGANPQQDLSTAGASVPYQLGGAAAIGTANPYDPALSKIASVGGKSGLGLEYVASGNGLGLPGRGTSYIYRLDRSGFHRIQCDLSSASRPPARTKP